ncbi:TetR/AcrR family transcriptional regulator [Nocardia sp. NBC_00881]|uniref:TetR/AcrR family transcriptional regulator n=1 Tax=Nocardia sp. NBC_00881 TaxID=2975995 RepID=UPI0038633C3A|nr:TetR/AcrR family transcriptional regulator [Nocardia sp. NBC_00881]
MARPRLFDEDRAVDAAMRAFWRTGYEATSTEDLCAATGLGRSSIYNAFTSKRDLFQRALRRYMTAKNAPTFDLLDGPGDVSTKIRTLLWQVVDSPDDDPLGCLVVNSTIELAPRDPEVAATLRADHERRLDALTAAFDSGRHAGDVAPDKDPRTMAHFVIATIGGMRVAARGGADRETLAAIATTALGAL